MRGQEGVLFPSDLQRRNQLDSSASSTPLYRDSDRDRAIDNCSLKTSGGDKTVLYGWLSAPVTVRAQPDE